MLYLDASVAVALIAPEPASERVASWTISQKPGALHISDWVLTEVASALAMKVRRKRIARSKRDEFDWFWYKFQTESLTCVEVLSRDFRSAIGLLQNPKLGLRAGDALHLSVAMRHRLIVVTLDETMASAGQSLGLSTSLV